MSNSSNENTETPPDGRGSAGGGISDEQLPEDLRPTDDNPLAQSPSEEEIERENEDASGPAEGEPPGAVPTPPNA